MSDRFPLFIDIEASTAEENGYPVAMSWSLPDGQLKSVLIIPDNDWDPWENADAGLDVQHLFDQGMTGADIIRELNEDLDGQTVFIDGLDDDERLLEMLFDTFQQSMGFELAPLTDLFQDHDLDTILLMRDDIAREFQLDLELIEDKVRAFIFLANEHQLFI
jgi:hypothetical protein